jgi:hypothetical protein
VARGLRAGSVFLDAFALDRTRSGSFLRPVSRFHSSKVSFEIFPSTSSCANLRRCAWLLNGMNFSPLIKLAADSATIKRSIVRASNDAELTIALEDCEQHVTYVRDVPIKSQILQDVMFA